MPAVNNLTVKACCLAVFIGACTSASAQRPRTDSPQRAPRIPQIGGESLYGSARAPKRVDGNFIIPPLIAPTMEIDTIGNGELPASFANQTPDATMFLPEGPGRPGDWTLTSYMWHAPNTFSHPLYFEDTMLERNGHERFPMLTPFVSGARFFATFPALPYLATVQPPCETNYSVGYYRPGSRAPALLQRPPYQRNAAIVEGAAIAGGIIAIP
ncbi:hypothetical protein FF011L_10190 [Roseimaritima multifibrata]|uniref:Uncharacterized protein n=1 Tax=Roseimaritima multifibrata TaxID=1930274 RepID=A0A517MBX8_9BACT|nr:hypothetical protein FF011L_10190 [Roseimaritima multifibrata]